MIRILRHIDVNAITSPAFLTAVLVLIVGGFYALIVPPFQVPDESVHFLRAYEIAQGHFISSGAVLVPEQVAGLILMFPPRLLSAMGKTEPIRRPEWKALFRQRLDPTRNRVVGKGAAGIYSSIIYSFIPYLPSAIALRLGAAWHTPPILLLYFGRLANLVLFAVLVYASIRILPSATLAFACLALMPMTLHQAASFSVDAVTSAAAFVWIAYMVALAVKASCRLLPRQYAFLTVLTLFSAFCKPNPWMPLVLAIVPASKFGSRWKWPVIAAIWILGILGAAGWQFANRQNVDRFLHARTEREIDVAANGRLMLHHPLAAATLVGNTIRHKTVELVKEFIGKLGWLDVTLPSWQTWGFLALLLFAAAHSGEPLDLNGRLWLLFVFVASVVTIIVWQAIVDLPVSYGPAVLDGTAVVNSIQGRYLIPIAPVCLFALSGFRFLHVEKKGIVGCVVAAAVLSAVSSLSVLKMYYSGAGEEPPANRTSLGLYSEGRFYLSSYVGRGNQVLTMRDHQPGDIPVAGDWTGDGHGKLGLYRHGLWMLDTDGDGVFDDHDISFYFGGLPGDIPVPGDWNGDGKSKAAIYRHGLWILDWNGTRSEQQAKVFAFGGLPQDIPLSGDWNGDRKSKVAVYRQGLWLLDVDGRDTEKAAKVVSFGGMPGDLPIAGDWNFQGRSSIGIYRNGTWILDLNGNSQLDGDDRVFTLDLSVNKGVPLVVLIGK